MADDGGTVPDMIESPTLTGQLLRDLTACEHHEDPDHQEALAGAEMADMLVDAFKMSKTEPMALDLFTLMLHATIVAGKTAAVIDALVTCVVRADRLLAQAMKRRAAMMEADPELAEKLTEAFRATSG